ncbi:MAG: hypothetical protein R2717_04035 [Schumannella sp.]
MHLTGHPIDDFETIRELALYRGRISGALTMRRHYAEQRTALLGGTGRPTRPARGRWTSCPEA